MNECGMKTDMREQLKISVLGKWQLDSRPPLHSPQNPRVTIRMAHSSSTREELTLYTAPNFGRALCLYSRGELPTAAKRWHIAGNPLFSHRNHHDSAAKLSRKTQLRFPTSQQRNGLASACTIPWLGFPRLSGPGLRGQFLAGSIPSVRSDARGLHWNFYKAVTGESRANTRAMAEGHRDRAGGVKARRFHQGRLP
jgi:hypothetical protein